MVPNTLEVSVMKALTYIEHRKFALTDKPKPEIFDPRDAIVQVTLGSICTSDLHIKHGTYPRNRIIHLTKTPPGIAPGRCCSVFALILSIVIAISFTT